LLLLLLRWCLANFFFFAWAGLGAVILASHIVWNDGYMTECPTIG
jgi:hypothetical protein